LVDGRPESPLQRRDPKGGNEPAQEKPPGNWVLVRVVEVQYPFWEGKEMAAPFALEAPHGDTVFTHLPYDA
jgi:hypothetical protein